MSTFSRDDYNRRGGGPSPRSDTLVLHMLFTLRVLFSQNSFHHYSDAGMTKAGKETVPMIPGIVITDVKSIISVSFRSSLLEAHNILTLIQ